MKPLLTLYCPSLEHRPFVDQATLKRIKELPIEFIRLSDNDWRSTGLKTRQLIQMARADWVMGMGDDDFLHPSTFEYILKILKGPGRTQLDMIGFNIQVYRDRGLPDLLCRVNPGFTRELEAWDGTTQLRPYAMPCPINKRMLEGIKWPDDQSWSEDNAIIMQVAPKFQKWEYLDKSLYFALPLHANPDRKQWSPRYSD